MNVEALRTLAARLPHYKMEAELPDALRCKRTLPSGQVAYQYSVIGVLADVYIAETHLGAWDTQYCGSFYLCSLPKKHWTTDVPEEVLNWYGVSRKWADKLWMASASHGFPEIADAITKWIAKNGSRGATDHREALAT